MVFAAYLDFELFTFGAYEDFIVNIKVFTVYDNLVFIGDFEIFTVYGNLVFIVYILDTDTGSDGPVPEKALPGHCTDGQEA